MDAVPERRLHARYPLDLEMSYLVLEGAHQGERFVTRTINMSSAGLRFVTTRPLHVGQRLEIAINWPPRLHGAVPLQLVGEGTVVRSSGTETAVILGLRAFKTRATGRKLVLG